MSPFDIVTTTRSVTILSSGLLQANPAHIKVYYWIQVFSSYITQDLNGKLQIISNNTSGQIGTLDTIIESKLSDIVNNLRPTIAAQISANILNNLREQLGLVQNTPLTITAIDPGVEIALTDNTNSNVLQYRRDSSAAWQPYDGSPIILENQGDYVQFKNTDEEWLNTYKERH